MCPSIVHADEFDREGIRGEIYCFPDKHVTKMVDKLDELKPSKRDVVDINIDPKFLLLDGGELPDRYFLRSKNGVETDFTVTAEGRVPDFMDIINRQGHERGENEVCIQDKARIGRPNDDEGLYFEMGLTPYFSNHSGTYDMALLREGTTDGKSIYKCMIPSLARVFMPDTNHIAVSYDEKTTPPNITAFKDGEVFSVPTEFYNDAHVFDLKPLRKNGFDEIRVEGGRHRLAPVPSIKTMKRYGVGEKNVTTQKDDTKVITER